MISPELQESLRGWLAELPWEYFVTLNLNRASTRSAVRTHFKRFCQYLDRSILGRRYLAHPEQRALIIVFLEHADTKNPHLHGLVLFQDGKRWGLVERARKVLLAWERAVKSGTIDMQEVYEPVGVARYITKECQSEKSYDSMMISSEFFGGEAAERNSILNRPLSFLDRAAPRRRATSSTVPRRLRLQQAERPKKRVLSMTEKDEPMNDDDDVPMTPENIKRAREELTEIGVIVDSGRKRRARNGELQTVWVTRERAASMGLKLPPLKVTREEAAYLGLKLFDE